MASKKPIKPLGILLVTVMLVWILAAIFGSRSFAAWLYGVEFPTRDQIGTAKAIIASPIVVVMLLFFGVTKWQDRRSHRAGVRAALYGAKLVEPSRERRLDMGGKDVN